MHKIIVLLATLVMISSTALADFDTSFQIAVPDSMRSLRAAGDLRQYVYSKATTERIAGCIRLGEIGGNEAFTLLVETFKKEPIRKGIELPYGVRYYALSSIGKIATPSVVKLLTKIAADYSMGIGRAPQSRILADSLSVIEGAFEGLYETGSDSAVIILQSFFNNDYYYWPIRLFANLRIVRYKLKYGDIRSAADSAHFLIDSFRQMGGHHKLYDSEEQIDKGFLEQKTLSYLVFEFRLFMIPYLSEFIHSLVADDPRLPFLIKLKSDMENNPPR